jgi:hypothetical protein
MASPTILSAPGDDRERITRACTNKEAKPMTVTMGLMNMVCTPEKIAENHRRSCSGESPGAGRKDSKTTGAREMSRKER